MLKYIASYIVGIALVVGGIFAGTTVASAQSASTTYACQYIWWPAFQYTNFAGKRWLESTRAWYCWVV